MRIHLLGLSVMFADAWTVPGAGALRTAHPLRAAGGHMNAGADLLGRLFSGGSKDPWPVEQCTAPTWEELRVMHDAQATEEQLGFRARLESGRGDAASLATIRRFDAPDGEEPRVTLYRDTASWCPYCEKVWIMLEEKRVPYRIEKVNMNCYGSKPASFLKIQPSGGIPVASVDGTVIRESNDILSAIEAAFPERPLIPPPSEASHVRVRPLLQLERQLFGAWFNWLGQGGSGHGAQLLNFEALLREVEAELEEGGGPYFLGPELSLVDCMFAPFLERMAASLPYYKVG